MGPLPMVHGILGELDLVGLLPDYTGVVSEACGTLGDLSGSCAGSGEPR